MLSSGHRNRMRRFNRALLVQVRRSSGSDRAGGATASQAANETTLSQASAATLNQTRSAGALAL
ncbi:MAG: hypothetical protein KatS3mg059_0817 [Thermomicrobiales bacterium]|nr:MAG: hypothetical protein KatS3mg059_0817 [Thermomicrobiales bacterium]